MSDKRKPDWSQYAYGQMSSQVTLANRKDRQAGQGVGSITGEAESLAGRLKIGDMGDRARETQSERVTRPKAQPSKKPKLDPTTKTRSTLPSNITYTNLLDAEDLDYRPSTEENRQIYNVMLDALFGIFGHDSPELVRSALDSVIAILKTEEMKDVDKKLELDRILQGTIDNDTFSQLLVLSRRITDYRLGPEGSQQADQDVALTFQEEVEAQEDEEQQGDMPSDSDESEINQDEMDVDPASTEVVMIGDAKEAAVRLRPSDVKDFWLQKFVRRFFKDDNMALTKTNEAMDILGSNESLRQVEQNLMEMIDYDVDNCLDLVQTLLLNKDVIFWCTKLERATAEDKIDLQVQMRERGLGWILKNMQGGQDQNVTATQSTPNPELNMGRAYKTLDLDSMIFQQGGHLMTNSDPKLPAGSQKITKKGYEEIHIPRGKTQEFKKSDTMAISKLPEWAHVAFTGMTHLNPMQSKVKPIAFDTDEPMLVCAPTGAGKTNVAMLAILRAMQAFQDEAGSFDLSAFKIIYISPMKALVQEQVENFARRLEPFGMRVAELTGDSQLSKERIAETQLIVTTPEKWDVITRKTNDLSYTNLVNLMIIDEIHLLHDDRGPVLEAIIARTIRRAEQTHQPVRIIGLSATLPNYQDVASFIGANPKKGVFKFGPEYRPVPLQQQYIGITETKALKRYSIMNDVCYEKTLDMAGISQTIIFVHSRKDTIKTARYIRDKALQEETSAKFIESSGETQSALQDACEIVADTSLKDLLPYGFGCHHAGLKREDRHEVEKLFRDGHIQVLVSTATLAWGVNLPAQTVIIKGTQVYSPEKGLMVELSPQDVLQMLGRAGRPGFNESYGQGIIITRYEELSYYLSLINAQLPIESQFMAKLADNLNAEIVLGSIASRKDAIKWLEYTYLYIRMLKDKRQYKVSEDYDDAEDPHLEQKRGDIIHTAASLLKRTGMITYEPVAGDMKATELGKIASYYYITHDSMAVYRQHLKPQMTLIDLFSVFALSNEFKMIPLRSEEKIELAKLAEQVPIPVKESIEEPTAKINVLLQAYISNLKLEGFNLQADMVFIQQSAGRILRGLFEISIKKGWAATSRLLLDMCKMIERRLWPAMTPLRQFANCRPEVIRAAEKKDVSWERYLQLDATALAELLRMPKAGAYVYALIRRFPRLAMELAFTPISRQLIQIDLTITADFEWQDEYHGRSEPFWILIEDTDGDRILHAERFLLSQKYADGSPNYVTLRVAMSEPLPPNYFVSVLSDRWMHCEQRYELSFRNLVLPPANPPHTKMANLQALTVADLPSPELQAVYTNFSSFNRLQSLLFRPLFTTEENIVLCAASGTGKTICSEFALLRLWAKQGKADRAVVLLPYDDMVLLRVKQWSKRFSAFKKHIVGLTGDITADRRLVQEADVIIATPNHWELYSRQWRKKAVHAVMDDIRLYIMDEIQIIGSSDVGPSLEICILRANLLAKFSESMVARIILIGQSLGTARDLGSWINCAPTSVYNFAPQERSVPLEVRVQAFNITHFPSLMQSMVRPAYSAIKLKAEHRPVIVFVPSMDYIDMTAQSLLELASADGVPSRYLATPEDALKRINMIEAENRRSYASSGIGVIDEAMSSQDRQLIEDLFHRGMLQILLCTRNSIWSLQNSAYMVIIFGVQYYDGSEHRYVDYALTEFVKMIGFAGRYDADPKGEVVLLIQQNRQDLFLKFIRDSALPLESQLIAKLDEFFNAEIAQDTSQVRLLGSAPDALDYLTRTYMFLRITQNPVFYGIPNATRAILNDRLSALAQDTIDNLIELKCIDEDQEEVSPEPLGRIASHYNVSVHTLNTFESMLTSATRLRGILEIVSHASEFDDLPVRRRDAGLLLRLYNRCPVKLSQNNVNTDSPYFKTHILLQAHFSRIALPEDLKYDQKIILGRVYRIICAIVQQMSLKQYSNAIFATYLAQMVIQGVWDTDSELKQVPHMSNERIKRCIAAGIETVADLVDMEDKDRVELLGMSRSELQDVATFANNHPAVEVSIDVKNEDLRSDKPIMATIHIESDGDTEPTVVAPLYPSAKDVSWWLMISSQKQKALYFAKEVSTLRSFDIEFVLPAGTHSDLRLTLMCDSYIGSDVEQSLPVLTVEQGDESGDDMSEST